MKQVTAIVLGAGQRGAAAYAEFARNFPNEMKVVGVAEPREDRRASFARRYGVPQERCYASWEEALAPQKYADCVLVCTQDRMHYGPTLAALEKGYHVLCEKPMSVDRGEMIEMVEAAKRADRVLSICHVLRYSPFFMKLKAMLDAGAVGQLVAVQHIECVGYWHAAHSYVRGNWRNLAESSPMILAKYCHDLDIMNWLVGSRCASLSSFGSLMHFTPEHRPEGAPGRCLDGCPARDECPYYAPRFYLDHPEGPEYARVISLDPSRDAVLEALRTGPYGRCVYACDNDVVDHQVVNLSYENGVTASMTMCDFTERWERSINIMGSRGQILGNMEDCRIEWRDFASGNNTVINVHIPPSNHGGSDDTMMHEFVALIASGGRSRTGADLSLESHLMALAAEESRLDGGRVIDMKRFRQVPRNLC